MDPTSTNITSSPPTGVDPLERMLAYFTWLISQSPSQAKLLENARNIAVDEGHNFNTIFKISNDEWKAMQVSGGIVMQIMTGATRFKKQEPKT